LRGLKYMHSANILHRDLKPRNLLVNANCDLKICDFGLARRLVAFSSKSAMPLPKTATAATEPATAATATTMTITGDTAAKASDAVESAGPVPMSSYVATRWYRAPEIILSKTYSKAVDMWGVGCIFAELLGRRPLFPGKDSLNQIQLIVSILGTPDPPVVKSPQSRDYFADLPIKPKIPFTQVFPHAPPLACDLLEKLLAFHPENRYTVEQALRHPYLELLHDESDEPVCDSLDPQEFYFEYLKTNTHDLRVLIQQDIMNNYPEEDDDGFPQFPQEDNGKFAVKATLPVSKGKAKRRRRKSLF